MEQNQALFSLSIDPTTKAYLNETSRWAKFLAIIGMIMMVLMVIAGLALAIGLSSSLSSGDVEYQGSSSPFGALAPGMIGAFYVIIAVIMFFPFLFLLRFANRMKAALHGNDQNSLNVSFQHLKSYFKFWGIVTIIFLAIYIIIIVFAVISMAALT